MAVLPTSVLPTSSEQNPNSSNIQKQPNPLSPQEGSREVKATDIVERKPDLSVESFEDLDSVEYSEKYKKYEADYARRLKSKYFSKKNIYGGSIFENETVIENETIKSSRWPCTRSFTDPVQSFEDQSRSSSFVAETSINLSNKKYQIKKNSC